MTPLEKLKEAAEKYAATSSDIENRTSNAFIAGAQSEAARQLYEPKWTLCSDKLPPFLEDVLTIDKTNTYRILQRQDWEGGDEFSGYESGEVWTDVEPDTDYEIDHIVAWQQLPPLPTSPTTT